jgi:hypothetical protein
MVGIHLVHEYGAVLSSVAGKISLRITVDIELAHHSPSVNRNFPDGGPDSFAAPYQFARKAYVY